MSEELWLFDIYIGDGALALEVSLPQAAKLRSGEGRPSETMRSIDEVEAGVGCLRKH